MNRKTKPKITILFVKQRKTSSNLSDKTISARVITSGKYQNPNDSERFPNASEDSFKTTFCSFSWISKHF